MASGMMVHDRRVPCVGDTVCFASMGCVELSDHVDACRNSSDVNLSLSSQYLPDFSQNYLI